MSGEHTPNPQLRTARQLRNWTLNDAARELRTLMVSRGETQVGVTLYAIHRWERGARHPDMRYRRYLCLLYGMHPDQLGFLPAECAEHTEAAGEITPPPTTARDDQTRRVAAPATQAALSVGSRRAAQRARAEDDLEALNLTRRKLLAASGLLSAAIGAETATEPVERVAEPLDRAARVASGRAAADDALIADLDAFTDGLARSSRRMAGDLLVEPISAHVTMVKSVLEQSMLPRQRERLLSVASRSAILMTGAQFFDRRNRSEAQRWLVEAIELGEATADPGTHVRSLIRAAELGVYTGDSQRSIELLEQARRLARWDCSPNTLSWILASQAEAYATLRQPQESQRLLDLSAEAQQRSRPGDETPWTEHWERSNVAGYIGAVHMRLEQPGKARAGLQEALADAAPSEVKFRSICLVDLAIAHMQDLDIEQACDLAGKALDIAGPMHYGTTLERMASLRRRLTRWSSVRAVRDLDERLQALNSV